MKPTTKLKIAMEVRDLDGSVLTSYHRDDIRSGAVVAPGVDDDVLSVTMMGNAMDKVDIVDAILVAFCTHMLNSDDVLRGFDEDVRREIVVGALHDMANDALATAIDGLCVRQLSDYET